MQEFQAKWPQLECLPVLPCSSSIAQLQQATAAPLSAAANNKQQPVAEAATEAKTGRKQTGILRASDLPEEEEQQQQQHHEQQQHEKQQQREDKRMRGDIGGEQGGHRGEGLRHIDERLTASTAAGDSAAECMAGCAAGDRGCKAGASGAARERFVQSDVFCCTSLTPEENRKAYSLHQLQVPSHHVCLLTEEGTLDADAAEIYHFLTEEMALR